MQCGCRLSALLVLGIVASIGQPRANRVWASAGLLKLLWHSQHDYESVLWTIKCLSVRRHCRLYKVLSRTGSCLLAREIHLSYVLDGRGASRESIIEAPRSAVQYADATVPFTTTQQVSPLPGGRVHPAGAPRRTIPLTVTGFVRRPEGGLRHRLYWRFIGLR